MKLLATIINAATNIVLAALIVLAVLAAIAFLLSGVWFDWIRGLF